MDFLPFTRPSIDEATIAGVAEVLRSGWITTGPKCRELEARLSERYGGRPVRLAASATGALEYALRVAGVGPGDEVITTPLSWVATANVVLTVGAQPVFVDVDPRTRNIDLDRVERAITRRRSPPLIRRATCFRKFPPRPARSSPSISPACRSIATVSTRLPADIACA